MRALKPAFAAKKANLRSVSAWIRAIGYPQGFFRAAHSRVSSLCESLKYENFPRARHVRDQAFQLRRDLFIETSPAIILMRELGGIGLKNEKLSFLRI